MTTENALDRAATTLRQHTDRGWVAIRENLFARALAVFRPSAPVRGRHPAGEFYVAADVLVACVRDALDAVTRAGAVRVHCTTDDRQDLEAVTAEVVALYGTPLLPLAQDVRDQVATALSAALGLAPERVRELPIHVGIADVTDDPALL
ncbi:hypothetical protein [Georgenia thermotolerans]|uniref:Uncharacterized protein n=1 Tax=Georgenia thermotolerans TaxID=527326 RepID=A0A7J5UT68_9MICO|nr:hypothetical protein [Georgenia thermotolerans]KAE8765474.1 hypothetical protein GB883_03530 [Georgenia thermotolerans]